MGQGPIPVVQIDRLTGKVVGKYDSIHEAAAAARISPVHIRNCIGIKRYGEGQTQAGRG